MSYILTYLFKQEQEENAFAQYGILVHDILDLYAQGRLESYELLKEFELRYDTEVTAEFPPLKNGGNMGANYYNNAVNYLSNFDGFGEYEIIKSEERFAVQFDDFIFNGIIDLTMKSGDDIIICDHKSKAGFKDEEEEKVYRRQLYLYSHYIHEKYGKYPKKLIFNLFRLEKFEEYEFNIDDFNEAVEWMRGIVARIRKFYSSYDYFFCNHICGHGVGDGICPMKDGSCVDN